MQNNAHQEEKILAPGQDANSAQWIKPQLTKTPLREALSGGGGIIDGITTGGGPIPIPITTNGPAPASS